MARSAWKRCVLLGIAVVFGAFVVASAAAGETTFTSTDGPVTINDYSSGPTPASPSPSVITVPGGFGTVTSATVTLHGMTHTCPEDLNVLVVAPNGSSVVLTAQTGACDAPSGDITFDDAAALPYSDSGINDEAAGTWRPSQASVDPGPGNCNWTGSLVGSAPAGPYGSTMSSVTGGPGSGTWKLYIEDGCGGDSGAMASWSLTLGTTSSGQINRIGYCSVTGNTTPAGKTIPPGTFLDLADGQPSGDSHYSGAIPALYYQGLGISCDNLPGYTKTSELVGYGGHGDPGRYTYMSKN